MGVYVVIRVGIRKKQCEVLEERVVWNGGLMKQCEVWEGQAVWNGCVRCDYGG